MSRTSEMKLRCVEFETRSEEVITIAYFYDTHIRLWTAYAIDAWCNQLGTCEYSPDKNAAIESALYQRAFD